MKGRMAVCRLINTFPSAAAIAEGKAGRVPYQGPNALALSEAQVKLGTEVHVITKGKGHSETVEGITIHRVPPPYNLNAFLEILRIHSSSEARIIHAHATTAYTVALARRLVGDMSLVVHIHGTTMGASLVSDGGTITSSWTRSAAITREKFMWRRAKRLLAVSENIRDELVQRYGVGAERVRVIHNGVDAGVFKPDKRREDVRRTLGWNDRKVILFVGQLSPRKGLAVLIRATQLIAKGSEGVKVVIVGGVAGYQEPSTQAYVSFLRRYVASLGLGPVVEFFGPVPNSELPRIYSAADVYVLPSFYEGLPKSMLEAMACEKPCVASDLVGIAAVLTDDIGIRVRPGDHRRLADAVISLLNDEQLRVHMGRNAREKVVRDLTWEKAAHDIRDIYAEIS
jgi:glycosyltransferase involved in cell wall biosynthesis